MGNIAGVYDAKEKGFVPGSGSLHSTMNGHGPERDVFEKASTVDLKPQKIGEGSMAFMFETAYMMKLTDFAINEDNVDTDYYKCWQGIEKHFDKNVRI
jgi:homogentisate 1,2-dioxygenase